MRLALIALRVILIAICLVVLVLTPLFARGPSGTSVDPIGAVIDVVVLVLIVGVAWSFFRPQTS